MVAVKECKKGVKNLFLICKEYDYELQKDYGIRFSGLYYLFRRLRRKHFEGEPDE